jgi:DNA polymerase-1
MDLTSEQKQKLYSIFKNTIPPSAEDIKRNANSCILLADGTNLFLRSWNANPAMDENGNHTGGISGSLKSLGYAIKFLAPTRCILVFDGVGGSFKRRKIFPEYKEHRKGRIRLNREYEELSDATEEEKSCKRQYIRLINYLQVLPVNILSLDHCEADDVLAYLAVDYFKNSEKIYVMSTDRDFLQLCNDKINVYSPTKKRIYGPHEVLEEYQIHPNNYVLFRALDGDDSDNVKGIEGAGPKTIVKHFPWLNEEKLHTVDEIISHAIDLRNKYKVCENISVGKDILDRNVALMQLKESLLTTTAQLHCNDCLETSKIPRLDRNAFFKLVRDDMIDSNLPNYISWINEVFDPLDRVIRSE